jgi:hypothetical protein
VVEAAQGLDAAAPFNARVETVTNEAVHPRGVQAHPLHHSRVGLLRMLATPDGKQPH